MFIEREKAMFRAIKRPVGVSASIVPAALFFTRTSLVGPVQSIENGSRCQLDKHNYVDPSFVPDERTIHYT